MESVNSTWAISDIFPFLMLNSILFPKNWAGIKFLRLMENDYIGFVLENCETMVKFGIVKKTNFYLI